MAVKQTAPPINLPILTKAKETIFFIVSGWLKPEVNHNPDSWRITMSVTATPVIKKMNGALLSRAAY